MKKCIEVEGITLAYTEANQSQEKTLFFVHGNSSSSRIWARQLEEPCLSGYRMLALDLPAHGDSSASDTPDAHYGLADLGRIVGKAICQLGEDKSYIAVGLSLGTNIVADALTHFKPKGIVLAGPTVVGKEVSFFAIGKPGVDSSALFLDTAPQEAVNYLFSSMTCTKDAASSEMLTQDYLKVKPPFRSMMFRQSLEAGRLSDELYLLNRAGTPVLIVVGQEDEVIRPEYLDGVGLSTWRSTIYKVPGAGHFVHLDQPEAFNELLLQYADAVFKELPAS